MQKLAKKVKCEPDEMRSWVKEAEYCREIQPDPTKVTLANMKSAVSKTLNDPKGCVPKPKGGGGGIRLKELGEYRRAVEEKTKKRFKDL